MQNNISINFNEQELNIIANFSSNTIQQKLNELDKTNLLNVLTFIKLSPSIFNELSTEQQEIFLKENIYLKYNLGCMQNYLSQPYFKDKHELAIMIYERLIHSSFINEKPTYIYSTPLYFYYYSKQNPDIWNVIDKNQYFRNAFCSINKKQKKDFIKQHSSLLLDWMAELDLFSDVIYFVLIGISNYYPNFKFLNHNKQTLSILLDKIIDEIQPSAFQWIYTFFYPVMTAEQEKHLLEKLYEWFVQGYLVVDLANYNISATCLKTFLVDFDKIQVRKENQYLINNIRFMNKIKE